MRFQSTSGVLGVLFIIFLSGVGLAQQDNSNQPDSPVMHGPGFVDANGDGFNDNAPDYDGDGIPNGQDPDYDGVKKRNGFGKGGFIDEDGDGLNDNFQDADGDGIPNCQDPDYERLCDGCGRKNGNGLRGESTGNGQHGRGQGSGRK